MTRKGLFGTVIAALVMAGCSTTSSVSGISTSGGKKWVGVMAVKESPLVNQVVRNNGNNPALYGPALRRMLDAGQIQPAPGQYCLIPYSGGQPADSPECFNTRSGVYTMWAPAAYVSPGKAMCARVPGHWPAIAGQTRYPANGGRRVNCYDFGNEAASAGFANSRHRAAMVVLVEPAN